MQEVYQPSIQCDEQAQDHFRDVFVCVCVCHVFVSAYRRFKSRYRA